MSRTIHRNILWKLGRLKDGEMSNHRTCECSWCVNGRLHKNVRRDMSDLQDSYKTLFNSHIEEVSDG